MIIDFVLLLVGLTVLYYGAEFLVDGASKIALGYGISPMIIGLTIVAFATSAPEFVVSLLATLDGSPALAIGNVVGSNIANIALIVGASAVILPMTVERSVFSRDYPFMMGSILLTLAIVYTFSAINLPSGLLLLVVLGVFLYKCLKIALKQNREFRATGTERAVTETGSVGANAIKVLGGVVGLVVGAQLMVKSAINIASEFGVPELVIGVTIVALGTSLPELATAIVAALKKEPDISLGNILGSNIFNTCFILGGVSVIKPIPVPEEALRFDLPAMAFVALLLFPLMRLGYKVTRADGILLLVCYVSYIVLSYVFAVA